MSAAFAVVHVPTGSAVVEYDTQQEADEALAWYAENWPRMARRLEVRKVVCAAGDPE